jgi:glycosyltransferase involved in cell wall biosynthesis
MNPKVYILILNWNGWKDTIECLESIFRNSYPNYQVVVIDNGSTNGSIEKIKAWAGGEQEVEVDPNNPLYNLSHPPVQKPIPSIEYDRKTAEASDVSALNHRNKVRLESYIKFGINVHEKKPVDLLLEFV